MNMSSLVLLVLVYYLMLDWLLSLLSLFLLKIHVCLVSAS